MLDYEIAQRNDLPMRKIINEETLGHLATEQDVINDVDSLNINKEGLTIKLPTILFLEEGEDTSKVYYAFNLLGQMVQKEIDFDTVGFLMGIQKNVVIVFFTDQEAEKEEMSDYIYNNYLKLTHDWTK